MVVINKDRDCILNKYINGLSHLKWKCIEDHKWNATLENVKNQDTWCFICARCNWSIENIQDLA